MCFHLLNLATRVKGEAFQLVIFLFLAIHSMILCAFFSVALHTKKKFKRKSTFSTALQILKYLIQPLFFLPTQSLHLRVVVLVQKVGIWSIAGSKAVGSAFHFYYHYFHTASLFTSGIFLCTASQGSFLFVANLILPKGNARRGGQPLPHQPRNKQTSVQEASWTPQPPWRGWNAVGGSYKETLHIRAHNFVQNPYKSNVSIHHLPSKLTRVLHKYL